MKYLKKLLLLLSGIALVACGTGTGISTNANTYGQLQSYSMIGTAATSVNILQDSVRPLGACLGIDEQASVIDDSPPSAGAHTGADLCNANYNYIEDPSKAYLFGADLKLDTFVASNAAGVTGVNQYKIIYNTPGQAYYYAGGAASNETVSGLVIVPQGITADKIKGVVLYYHATVLSKNGVPSDNTSVAGQYTEWLLSSVYASQGYIVVAPDYVGQGIDVGVMHPYVLYAETNALSGINMLTATRQLLSQLSIAIPNSEALGLYISSYSEGGAYALWASRLLSGQYSNVLATNNLTLKRTVGVSGAYNLSGAMLPYAYNQTNNNVEPTINTYNASPGIMQSSPFVLNILPVQQMLANFSMAAGKASLASYAFTAFINYNFTPAAYAVLFRSSSFVNMASCVDIGLYVASVITGSSIITTSCPITDSLQNLFMNSSYKASDIGGSIFASAMAANQFFTGGNPAKTVMGTIANGGTSNNSVNAFADPVLSDPSLMSVIRKADTWSYVTSSPISLVYLDYDSTVPNLNSTTACSLSGVKGLSANEMVNCLHVDNTQLYTAEALDLEQLSGIIALMQDHGQAEFVLNLVALNQIKITQ